MTNKDWVSVDKALPKDKQVVLIYTNEIHVFGHSGEFMNQHVATFVKGRTAAEVEKSKRHGSADEHGNNLRPFYWNGSGTCSWFGQVVTHWVPLPDRPPYILKRDGDND